MGRTAGRLNGLCRCFTPAVASLTPPHRKALSVRIRLHGTATDVAATLAALAAVLDIRAVSREYHDRPPSTLIRVYLDATLKEGTRR